MINRLLAVVHDLDQLVRFHQLGYVCVWPLLGWACVSDWSLVSVARLLMVVFFWHTFAAILNDVIDLDVDRRDPLRADGWLVRGTLTERQALVVSFAQLPLMLGAHIAAGFPRASLLWLLGGAVGESLYDVYGKRCPIPLLTELAQASAAFLVTIYGAAASGKELNGLVWMTAAAAAAFVLLVNGFHGSLRDIAIDRHKHTASIWLGCRVNETGAVRISRSMSLYAAFWQGVVIAVSLLLATAWSGTNHRVGPLVAVVAAAAANVSVFIALHRLKKPAWDVVLHLHVGIAMLPVMLAFVPRLGPLSSTALFLFYMAPAALTIHWWCSHRFARASSWQPRVPAKQRLRPGASRKGLDLGRFVGEHRGPSD